MVVTTMRRLLSKPLKPLNPYKLIQPPPKKSVIMPLLAQKVHRPRAQPHLNPPCNPLLYFNQTWPILQLSLSGVFIPDCSKTGHHNKAVQHPWGRKLQQDISTIPKCSTISAKQNWLGSTTSWRCSGNRHKAKRTKVSSKAPPNDNRATGKGWASEIPVWRTQPSCRAPAHHDPHGGSYWLHAVPWQRIKVTKPSHILQAPVVIPYTFQLQYPCHWSITTVKYYISLVLQ